MVSEGRRVVLQKPSGDESVGRSQNANEGKMAKIREVQFVGLEGGDDGVDLFRDFFQFGQASPVLDVGFDPLVNSSLGGGGWSVVLQYWSIGADDVVLKWIQRDSRRCSSLLRFRCSGFEARVQSAPRARRSWRGDEWLGFVHAQAFTISRGLRL